MKIALKTLVLVFLYSFSLPSYGQVDTLVEVMKAGNARDIENDYIAYALASKDPELISKTLVVVGNIGGSKAADFIRSKLSDPRAEVRYTAAFAAGIAGDATLFDDLKVAAASEKTPRVAARMYHSMGYITPEAQRPYFALQLLGTSDPVIQRGILDGYMQAIVYSKLKASELLYTNFNIILDIAKGAGGEAAAAAYFLGRVEGLETELNVGSVVKAINETKSKAARVYLLRVLGRLGGDNSSAILPFLYDKSGAIRLEAIRGMGDVRELEQVVAFQSIALSDFPVLRKAVIDVFAASDDMNFMLEGKRLMDTSLADSSIWVQGAALRAISKISKEAAQNIAKAWYESSSSYKKGYAIALLAESEAFKQDIEALSEDSYNPYLQNKARQALGLEEIDYGSAPQPVPPYEDAVRASLSKITFETTKGLITVQLSAETPFTAYNFVQLAQEGVFDGMLFHRVIGNFVAQAGERTTALHEDWGPIRSEWTDISHEIGTVGLATNGKDTGTRQFFFNTGNNRHLDGRYTVFGKVVEGFNVMMNLEEGDSIFRATVE